MCAHRLERATQSLSEPGVGLLLGHGSRDLTNSAPGRKMAARLLKSEQGTELSGQSWGQGGGRRR